MTEQVPPESEAPSGGRSTPEPPSESQEWRQVHRVTPLLNAWKVAAAIVAIVVWQGLDDLRETGLPFITLAAIAAGVVAVGIIVGLGYSWLAWRRLSYRIGSDAVVLRSGVLFRRERVTRLNRVQSVEVTQPLLARIFSFASLKVESAGGSEAGITLSFLTEADAQAVRNEILARAAGIAIESTGGPRSPEARGVPGAAPIEPGLTAAQGVAAPIPAAPERQVYEIDAGRLVLSTVVSGGMVGFVLVAVGILVVGLVSGTWEWLISAVLPVLGLVGFLWTRFSSTFGFRVATSPDGVRVRQGLLETTARTIPPGRVQAVQVSQPLLWRGFGWWRVQVTIAATGEAGQEDGVLVPVATLEEVFTGLRLVVPGVVADDLAALQAGLTGMDGAQGWTTSPRRMRWLDPLSYRRNGYRITDSALLMRAGRLWRTLQVVPHERTQSLGVTQGPLQRRLRVATFEAHTTPGSIAPTVSHLDEGVAAELMSEQEIRARRARAAAGPERWMRVSPPAEVPAPSVPSAPPVPSGPSAPVVPQASPVPAVPPVPPAPDEPSEPH